MPSAWCFYKKAFRLIKRLSFPVIPDGLPPASQIKLTISCLPCTAKHQCFNHIHGGWIGYTHAINEFFDSMFSFVSMSPIWWAAPWTTNRINTNRFSLKRCLVRTQLAGFPSVMACRRILMKPASYQGEALNVRWRFAQIPCKIKADSREKATDYVTPV